jgi:ribonuclease D
MSSTALWVAEPAQLRSHLANAGPRIGLDTEFIRERTYWPQLALVQLAVDDHILLIDPLAPGVADALRPLLTDRSVLKVMHSAGEDLVAFGHTCGVLPAPLFDTQTAAALAGVGGGIGYQRLVQELLGIALPKGETRSDWLRRPLSAAQLDYAAEDVNHLFALHDALSDELSDELTGLLPALPPGVPTDAELRMLQAQLNGWLAGLFQGFQAAALKPADFFGNDDELYLMEDIATGEIRVSILW